MNIVNTTTMVAEITLAKDREGAEHYLLVIKGTFDISHECDLLTLADEQRPLVYADKYYGDPATTSIKEAYDFAFSKPKTDIVVVGCAYAPRGSDVTSLNVDLVIGKVVNKTIRVVGNRVWERGLIVRNRPTEPKPFKRMPLVYERAFGGVDTSHTKSKRHKFHRENLVGVGLHANTDPKVIVGTPLPNLESPSKHIARWGQTTETACLAFVSPSWAPRSNHAGTYDLSWLDSVYPLLPHDFDDFFYQSAPADQVVSHLNREEKVHLTNMNPDGPIRFTIPRIDLPVVFMFKNGGDQHFEPQLDTVVIWAEERKVSMTWRLTVRRIGKIYSLRQVVIGEKSKRWYAMQRSTRPYDENLSECLEAKTGND